MRERERERMRGFACCSRGSEARFCECTIGEERNAEREMVFEVWAAASGRTFRVRQSARATLYCEHSVAMVCMYIWCDKTAGFYF